MAMQRSIVKRALFSSFVLSILLHLLFLLLVTTVVVFYPVEEKKPHLYVPAYTYTAKSAPQATAMPSPATPSKASQTHADKPVESSKHGIMKQSIMALSMNMLQQNQKQMLSSLRNSEPIYLIGDDHQPADPLIKLIGIALSAHFEYPRLAGEMGIKGRVFIAMTLSPDGHFSDIQMVRSSDSADLDAAALYAVNSAPIVRGADRFISAPKHFVIGFVFR